MKTTNKINWVPYHFGEYVNIRDLKDGKIKQIIEDNFEYLHYSNGDIITEAGLCAEFLIIKIKGKYHLTMNDQDFYINDIIFTE